MKYNSHTFPRSAIGVIALAALIAIGIVTVGPLAGQQAPRPIIVGGVQITGLPDDWTHHHLIFSTPQTAEEATKSGTYNDWLRIVTDPRYIIQQLQRGAPAQGPAANDVARLEKSGALEASSAETAATAKKRKLHRDWSVNLGSGATVGAGQYPAKYSFNPIGTPNCSTDFVVYNTGLAGSSGQASIVAYNNIYATTCSSVPSVYWKYNTGGTVSHSVVLSADGSQVAFVQGSSLFILKWKANSALVTPNSVSTTSYRSCPTLPCMTSLSLTAADTYSSPYYDYGSDTLFVGDDGPSGVSGSLNKFTGVFSGTPTAAGHVLVGSDGFEISSPVYDPGSGKVFVGNLEGYFYSVIASSMTGVVGSSLLDLGVGNGGYGILDAPIVDSTAGQVYVFVGTDGSSNSGVFQFPTSSVSGSGTEKAVGSGPGILYSGAFDNQYFSSSSPTSPTGNLYVCGNTGGAPHLYRIPISANSMLSAQINLTLTTATPTCSPVTEIYNSSATGGPFDWIYLSVQGSGSPTACGSVGCLMNFIVSSWQASFSYPLGQRIIDSNGNVQVVTTAGISNTTPPATWATTAGSPTTDHTATWTCEGPLNITAFVNNHSYALNAVLLDSNFNLQRVTTAGTSQSSGTPSWSNSFGGVTSSGSTLKFTNQGPGSVQIAETGGTSGIIIDNTSTVTGASQIYFSTLANGGCGGGCAIQASQAVP